MKIENLDDKQKDALKELGNIGAAHAATALSQMIGQTIEMSVPKVTFVRKAQIEKSKKFNDIPGISIYMDMYGKINGKILIFFEYKNAMTLTEILLRKDLGTIHKISEVEESALKEVGNILASSYLNAISQVVDGILLPSVPHISIDTLAGVLSYFSIRFKDVVQNALWIETELRANKTRISGDFFLFPDEQSLKTIFEMMKV
ncbi:chemotaxis protein CheC [Candidatus Calescamantes bacterium]|nr:chemotaxis protein CheC [Candidatus Calescamantes bacterium]MCK5598772.1 chemotaxis protein CheC [bacterium]